MNTVAMWVGYVVLVGLPILLLVDLISCWTPRKTPRGDYLGRSFTTVGTNHKVNVTYGASQPWWLIILRHRIKYGKLPRKSAPSPEVGK